MKKEKILEWTLAFALGVLLPILSIYLAATSCPSGQDETFALPIVSAECPGDLIGQIGFFIFSLPLIVTFIIALLAEYFLFQTAISDVPIIFFGFAYLLGSLVNMLFYWLIIRGFFYLRRDKSQHDESNEPFGFEL